MTNEATWLDRVVRWRASGMTSDAFAAGEGVSAGGLRYWSSRLGREGKVPPETRRRPRRSDVVVSMAKAPSVTASTGFSRIVVGGTASATTSPTARSNTRDLRTSIAIDVGGAVIRVEAGFDAEVLRAVVAALAGGAS